MGTCAVCGTVSEYVSAAVGVCGDCLRSRPSESEVVASKSRGLLRAKFGLPLGPPRSDTGYRCPVCANACCLDLGQLGYCGVRIGSQRGVVPIGGEDAAVVEWYLDPIPTNCVAAWACAATGVGYPQFSRAQQTERGYYNLAVFYNGCNFDCLFCQNWRHRYRNAPLRSVEELVEAALNPKVTCVCFFGGDSIPQHEHALKAAEQAIERKEGVLRICWETNGGMSVGVLRRMIELSQASGGTIKFDLKAWSESLHRALCGASNTQTLANFRILAETAAERPQVPLAAASTLLVPGYVEREEVAAIAKYIADINPSVPYTLLAFHPDYAMNDLPTTSRRQAEECLEVAREAGLERVRLGNVHLLS